MRTGMAEPGEYSPRPRKLPRASFTSTSSPPWAPPSMRSTACANTQGCPAQTGWTCPGFNTTLATGGVLALWAPWRGAARLRPRAMRRLAVFAAALSSLGAWAPAARAAGDCPDGDWFCEPPPAADPAQGQPEASPAPAKPERGPRGGRGGRGGQEPSAFEPPPPPGMDDGQVRIDVERVQPARPRHRRGFREWGVNLHANVGLMGNDELMSPDADMNGLGGALRFRPIPYIAIEGSVELLWGT